MWSASRHAPLARRSCGALDVGTVFEWDSLLRPWSEEIFANETYLIEYEVAEQFPAACVARTCSRPGASENYILAAEKRLKTSFPPSFRSFLNYSNGWEHITDGLSFFGTDELRWFREEHQEWIDIWNKDPIDTSDELYFNYGPDQDCTHMRAGYLQHCLQLSTTEDGYVFLLNPRIIDTRSEWEAWDFGPKLPGAYRYPSFWEMMVAQRDRSIRVLQGAP